MAHTTTVSTISSASRVVLIPLRFVGDTLLTLPIAANLKAAFAAAGQPSPHITMLCSPATQDLARNHPAIDNVLVEDADKQWQQTLRQSQFSHAIIFRKSATMAHQCKAAGIAVRVGYDMQRFFAPIGFQRWGLHLTHTAPYPAPDTHIHQVVHHWGVVKAVGLSVPAVGPPLSLSLHTTPEDAAAVTALMTTQPAEQHGKPLVVLHSRSASASKQLPAGVFVKAVQWLHANGYAVMATGLAHDADTLDALADQAKVPLWNMAGKTTLGQLYPLFKHVVAYVGVDSGPLHIAAAAGVKRFVALYGPTNAKQWGPYGAGIQVSPVFYDANDDIGATALALEDALKFSI